MVAKLQRPSKREFCSGSQKNDYLDAAKCDRVDCESAPATYQAPEAKRAAEMKEVEHRDA